MKSAAKLRHVGKGTAAVAVAAMVAVGLSPTANAAWAVQGGTIGINDTSGDTDNQGATLLTPGAAGAQTMGEVVLSVPNVFKNGDYIDLAIFDRSADDVGGPGGVGTAGNINSDAAHKLVYSGTPTVGVDSKPYVAATNVLAITDTAANNAEYWNGTPTEWTAANKPTQAPVFTTSLVASSRANGLGSDVVRLTINGVQANGDATAKWRIKITDLKVMVGSEVTPGSLRVVPFAYDSQPGGGALPSELFGDGTNANTPDDAATPGDFDPEVYTYTVPAFVSPVSINVASPNIINDSTEQNVGPITITEANKGAINNGTYTLTINGATVVNQPATLTLVSGTGAQTVGPVTVTPGANGSYSFTIAGTDAAANNAIGTYSLSGLALTDSAAGPVTYTLTGGAGTVVGAVLGSNAGADTAGVAGVVPPEDQFWGGTVNQTDILPPTSGIRVTGSSQPPVQRIAGNNRYETAAKIAFYAGASDFVILASAYSAPDSLSAGYLSHRLGGAPILLTPANMLHETTKNAIQTLGAKRVFILGSNGAINQAVEDEIKGMPQYDPNFGGSGNLLDGGEALPGTKMQVLRLGDADRYGTNARVNGYASGIGGATIGRTVPTLGSSSKATVFLTDGQLWADALAAAPLTKGRNIAGGISNNLPLVMTPGAASTLTTAASNQMRDLDVEHVIIVGSTGAVSQGIEDQIKASGRTVERVAGPTRYETAVELQKFARRAVNPTATVAGGLGWDGDTAYLAYGQNFPDALASAPLVSDDYDGLFLTPSDALPDSVKTYLQATAGFDRAIALGSGGVISTATLTNATQIVASNG